MNKVLIIGGSGLLGQSLVEYFVSNNFQVGALSRHCNSQGRRFSNYAVDVLDYENLELVVAQYDVIINCIGQITNPIHECVSLNTKGITNIIDAVKKNGNYLIHLSTIAVYGSSSMVNEKSAVDPESVYGSFKYFAEYQIKQNLTNYVNNIFKNYHCFFFINFFYNICSRFI